MSSKDVYSYYLQDSPLFVIDGEPRSVNDCIYRAYEIKHDFEGIPKDMKNCNEFQTSLYKPGRCNFEKLKFFRNT